MARKVCERCGKVFEGCNSTNCRPCRSLPCLRCNTKQATRGLCKYHYARVRAGLDPEPERFKAPHVPWPSVYDRAWAAGLFEGEGSISLNRRPNGAGAQMSLRMSDEDTVRRFAQIVGVGTVVFNSMSRTAGYRRNSVVETKLDSWDWHVSAFEKLQHVVCLLWPGLCERRRMKCIAVLTVITHGRVLPPQSHCKRGHEFSEENTYRDRHGARYCRACRRERRRAAQKAGA